MVIVAKMTDGRIVEIVRVAETVGFSDEKRWIMVCFDFELINRRRDQFKWYRANEIKFDWVREYTFD